MRKWTYPFQDALLNVLSSASNRDSEGLIRWRSAYWLYAGIFPGALFAFAGIRISLYHIVRAPNVGSLVQIALTLVFYLVWLVITRLIWVVIQHELRGSEISYARLAFRLGGMGLVLMSGHLFLWTLIHVTMYASAAWAWQPIHLLHVFGEVCLDQAGLWLLAYIFTAVIILLVMTHSPEPARTVKRFEVKQNGKLMSIPLPQIYWFKAAGNYVELYTDGGMFTVRKTLSETMRYIGKAGFLKSHRGALVNASHVVAIKPDTGRSGYVVLFSNGEQAPLSRRKLTEFRKLLSLTD